MIDELDHGGLLGGPEILPAAAEHVLMFGEQLVEVLQELRKAPGGSMTPAW
jgi:hypothetical protein